MNSVLQRKIRALQALGIPYFSKSGEKKETAPTIQYLQTQKTPPARVLSVQERALAADKNIQQISETTASLASANNSPQQPEQKPHDQMVLAAFHCCLFVFIQDKQGFAMVADIANNKHPENEQALLQNMLARLGIQEKNSICKLFSWPISKTFCDKASAVSALQGMLSNWQQRSYLLVMGATGLDMLQPMYATAPPLGSSQALHTKGTMIYSHCPAELLTDTSLRHATWQHTQALRQTN